MAGKTKQAKPRKAPKAKKKLSNLERHAIKCTVCNSPERSEIEALYLEGESPYTLAEDFKIPHVGTIYRHAKVLGLDLKRDNSTLTLCRKIIDKGQVTKREITDTLLSKGIELQAKITKELEEKSAEPAVTVNLHAKLNERNLALAKRLGFSREELRELSAQEVEDED